MPERDRAALADEIERLISVVGSGCMRAHELLAEKYSEWSPEYGTRFTDKYSQEADGGLRAAQTLCDLIRSETLAALRQDAGAAMREAPATSATTITPERRALYEQVQTLVAGHSVLTVLSALSDSLASSVAFAADDIGAAEQLLDDLVPDMKSYMRENWSYIQELRMSPNAAGGRA